MNEIYVICEPCIGVKDGACQDICPVDCIFENDREEFPEMLFIQPDDCIACGICEPECPVEAIYPKDDVPKNGAGISSSTLSSSNGCAEPAATGEGKSQKAKRKSDRQRKGSVNAERAGSFRRVIAGTFALYVLTFAFHGPPSKRLPHGKNG